MDFESFVLAASTADLDDEPVAREHADAIEFRMDLADDPRSALRRYDGELPIIATNRAAWEGGEADDEGRLETLAEVTRLEAIEAIDVELSSIRDGSAEHLLETARARDVAVIVSHHDFERTPSAEAMRSTLESACAMGAVGKLAVTAESLEDALSLLAVTRELSAAGETVATMAMGEVGRHTRVVAPVYGSKIGYAPVETDESTAPGQFHLTELAKLIRALE